MDGIELSGNDDRAPQAEPSAESRHAQDTYEDTDDLYEEALLHEEEAGNGAEGGPFRVYGFRDRGRAPPAASGPLRHGSKAPY